MEMANGMVHLMRTRPLLCLLGVLVAATCLAPAQAQSLPEPATVIIKTGDLSAELQRRDLWNLQRISYRGVEVATPTGVYGTVISIPAIGGWVGGGHTQGAVEQIEQVTLTVDGQPAELVDGAIFACDEAVLSKTSMLDKVRLESTYTFREGTITELVRLTATEDVTVITIYPFMHCLSAETREWMAITGDNQETGGEFTDSKELQWHEGWEWTAAYIPDRQTGFMLRQLKAPEGIEVQTGYWDQDRYHKLYVSTPLDDEVWVEGRSLEAEVIVTCFEATPDAWKPAACQVAAGLVAE